MATPADSEGALLLFAPKITIKKINVKTTSTTILAAT
jgi:hypothetical protein